jgi:hypothetical protein
MVEPGQPRLLVFWPKMLRKFILRVQFITIVVLGPEKLVKRDSGHTTFLLSGCFPTARRSSQHRGGEQRQSIAMMIFSLLLATLGLHGFLPIKNLV